MIRVPITIITGFLGAGKTSLLNHLLRNADGLRIAVLVNDFGALNIDAKLISQADGDVVSLENGCICCSLSEGLLASVAKVIRRPKPPDCIVVETSGVSNPIEVVRTLADPELQSYVPLDCVVTVVDAEAGPALHGEGLALGRHQISAADVVVLNKTDLVNIEELHRAKAWIQAISPVVRVVKACHGQVPAAIILGVGGKGAVTALGEARKHEDRANGAHDHSRDARHTHSHEESFESFAYENASPISVARLHSLLSALPPTVYRVKGTLNLAEQPSNRCILQATAKRAAVTVDGPWKAETPITQILFIGEKGSISTEFIRRSLGEADEA
jgi:G3E family GTPase